MVENPVKFSDKRQNRAYHILPRNLFPILSPSLSSVFWYIHRRGKSSLSTFCWLTTMSFFTELPARCMWTKQIAGNWRRLWEILLWLWAETKEGRHTAQRRPRPQHHRKKLGEDLPGGWGSLSSGVHLCPRLRKGGSLCSQEHMGLCNLQKKGVLIHQSLSSCPVALSHHLHCARTKWPLVSGTWPKH